MRRCKHRTCKRRRKVGGGSSRKRSRSRSGQRRVRPKLVRSVSDELRQSQDVEQGRGDDNDELRRTYDMEEGRPVAAAPARDPSPVPAPDTLTYLQQVCDDANFCTAFGRETALITEFFNFATFQYARGARTLQKGSNGFVTELFYEREGYRASAVLKTDLNVGADNLYLEAYNGMKYINQFARQFPTWLETYGAYTYRPGCGEQAKSLMYHNALTAPAERLAACLDPIQTQTLDAETLGKSCMYNSNMALLIQYINKPMTMSDWIKRYAADKYRFCVELATLLFQIYAVLSSLSRAGVFTHFDLHPGNVLLYEIPNGKYVRLRYINGVDGGICEFPTRHIVKIIDYGRAFLPENAAMYVLLCTARDCNREITGVDKEGERVTETNVCGEATGYTFFEDLARGSPADAKSFYISTNRLNNAHDLRLVHYIYYYYGDRLNTSVMATWLKLIMRSVMIHYTTEFGAPTKDDSASMPGQFFPQTEDTGDGNTRVSFIPINTVNELYWSLWNYITQAGFMASSLDDMYTNPANLYATMEIDLEFKGMDNITPMKFDFA